MRICRVCQIEKSLSEYNKKGADYTLTCNECLAAKKERVQEEIRATKYTFGQGRGFEPASVIKELYRHRESLRDYRVLGGKDFFEYAGFTFAISELDLAVLDELLSERQRDAFYNHIVLDQPTAKVAEQLGISAVSVTQYANTAAQKLAKYHFPEKFEGALSDTLSTA